MLFCRCFYTELDLTKDRHILALYLSAITDGKISYRDAIEMSAKELISSFDFFNIYNREIANGSKTLDYQAIKRQLK